MRLHRGYVQGPSNRGQERWVMMIRSKKGSWKHVCCGDLQNILIQLTTSGTRIVNIVVDGHKSLSWSAKGLLMYCFLSVHKVQNTIVKERESYYGVQKWRCVFSACPDPAVWYASALLHLRRPCVYPSFSGIFEYWGNACVKMWFIHFSLSSMAIENILRLADICLYI